MNEKTFEEKMKILKEMHSRSHPEAIAQIMDWEEKFARLQANLEWLGHPNTKELAQLAVEQISLINNSLANGEALSDVDRNKLFAQKNAHMVYLAVLSNDPQSEMRSIESSVDAELTNK